MKRYGPFRSFAITGKDYVKSQLLLSICVYAIAPVEYIYKADRQPKDIHSTISTGPISVINESGTIL